MSKIGKNSHLTCGSMKMPWVGLGTWQLEDNVENGEAAIECALDAGYRHIDTALVYGNEKTIGEALKKYFATGKLKREDLFVVTKLPPNQNRPEYVERCIKSSLKDLQLDYIDLYLVHWPVGYKYVEGNSFPLDDEGNILLDMDTDIIAVWKAMEKQVEAGRAKSIGLSNFNPGQISRVLKEATIKPANLQIEVHLHFQQKELMEFCKKNGVSVCAYAPLGSPGLKAWTEAQGINGENFPTLAPMSEPAVTELAAKYKKLPSQILLRFVMQLGAAVIPKSTNPTRIKANLDVFDFELTDDEMTRLIALDHGDKGRLFSKEFFKGLEKHPEYPF